MSRATHADEAASATAAFLDFTPTTADLIQIARTSGRPGASLSTIRHWRNQGLVSPPFRHEGVWRYPLAAVGEVDLLARYGRRELGDDLLEFARYVETSVGDLASVKDLCVRLLTTFRPGAAEAAALAAQGPEAIHATAAEMARQRGTNAFFPREVRMGLQQRVDAHEYMLSKLLGVEVQAELQSNGPAQMARGLGLHSGHGGPGVDISEVLPDVGQWQLDLETLIEAVRDTTRELAELARRSVAVQHLWMPAMFSALWEDAGPRDVALLRVAQTIAGQQSPKMYPLGYAAAVVRKQSTLSAAEIRENFAGPDEALGVAAAVLDSPDADSSLARLSTMLRPYPRVQLRLAVAKLRASRRAPL